MLVIRVSSYLLLLLLILFDMFVVVLLGVPIAKFSANHITCTLFILTNIQYPKPHYNKVAKSIKSKVAKEHKYSSGDIVAAAKEAQLAANKSSIKAALQSKTASKSSKQQSFAAKLKKQGGKFNDIPIGRGSLGRGELVKKSGVDVGSTSSSKYTRRTTYGSGKRSVRGGVMKQQSYDDPLDVAAAAQRSSSYQDSVGSTKAAVKKTVKPWGVGTKAAAEKKQPPINNVKKSKGAKSSSTSGGCSLSNVGCNKAVDKKVAAKSSSSTATSTKSTSASTKSTTSASTAESDTSSESPSAIEKNLSKLRTAAKNAARSAAAKSTSTTSKSNSTASSTQKGPWQCDFCFTAKFDSYNDEAKEHEECCQVRYMCFFLLCGAS